MVAPYSNSERKASSHAKLSLRGLWSRVPRTDLRQIALYAEWLEPSQRPETLAEVSLSWSILRSVPAEACAHVYGRRTNCFRVWPFIKAVVPSFFLRTQESAFGEMAWESAAAQVRATQGCDPRPIRLTRLLGLFFCRGLCDVHGSWSAACSRRGANPLPSHPRVGFARGEGRGEWGSSFYLSRGEITQISEVSHV
jgi:hypothetical protein